MPLNSPRGLYFEDFAAGDEYVTPARTITEADLVSFATLTGDFNPIHTDAEFAKGTIFGQRVAHGLLGLSYGLGLLASRSGMFDGTVVAFLGMEWKFTKPLFIGDTIHLKGKVTKTRPTGPEAGIVVLDAEIYNQRDELLQKGTLTVLMKRKGT